MSILVKVGTFFLTLMYGVCKLLPTKARIVMISRQSNEVPFEFTMLKEEVIARNEDIEVVCLCKMTGRSMDGGKVSLLIKNIPYLFHMLKQMYYLATSNLVVLDGYCILVSLLHHKKELTIIQMWHSMGTMKLFGWGIVDQGEGTNRKLSELMHMHEHYDYYFASSPAYQAHLARGFRCSEEKARIFPLPRYDLLTNKTYQNDKSKEIKMVYPSLVKGKTILYCPTQRKDEHQMKEALEQLIACLPQGYQMIVKLHPLSTITLTVEHAIFDKRFSTLEMLSVADFVISDYSCVVYEAAVLSIPLCFYNFDYGKYQNNRGLALDYENELPGVISADPAIIMKAIACNDFKKEEIQQFADKYIRPTKHATKDIVDFFISLVHID